MQHIPDHWNDGSSAVLTVCCSTCETNYDQFQPNNEVSAMMLICR